MEDIREYLEKKISKIGPLSGKQGGTGATILRFDKSNNDLEEYIRVAIMQITFCIQRSESAGIAKLTQISTSIGQRILSMMGDEDPPFSQKVRLGDLFVEALFALGYINVYRDPSFSEHNHEAPYVVHLGTNWDSIGRIPLIRDKKDLRGTLFTPPRYPNKSVLKRDNFSQEEWEVIRDSQHILAVHKLQQVPMRVNLGVLSVVEKNKDKFINTDQIVIPMEGNKKKMEDAYYSWRMAEIKAKGETSTEIIHKKKNYLKQAELWNKKLIALKAQSKKTMFEYTIQKANVLKHESRFYQTIELDYRGRYYYVESFFNFQGTDEARGLMEFAEGKPITTEGRRWLSIHTASSYNQSYDKESIPDYFTTDYVSYLESEGLDSISVDKMTLDDRALWTENNLDQILNDVTQGHIRTEAEKPVVYYACCLEWAKYLADPDNHLSHLPIQIDGSNNGWQHLAAISKDEKTAELVGIIPNKIQKDFYVQTAKSLIEIMPEWFEKHKMPMKHIRKGISKRGSMTRAYSAGERTMATNMYADCYQEDFTTTYGITIEDCNELAHNLIAAINKVCPGPLQTMSYLQKLASFELGHYKVFRDGKIADKKYKELKKELKKLLYKKDITHDEQIQLSKLVEEQSHYESKLVDGNGSNVITWMTPSGFCVVYENFITRTIKCKGTIKGINRITHVAHERTEMPNIRGFMSGISPNYVHSLDSSHMSIVIDNYDGAFAAVHDAFATHASDVDKLVSVTKETFIMMYEEENFYNYMEQTILSSTEGLTVEQPSIGKLDLDSVRDSSYFFS